MIEVQAVEQLESAFSLVEDRGPSPEKAYVLQELSRITMMGSDFERAIELGSESLRLAEELGLDSRALPESEHHRRGEDPDG